MRTFILAWVIGSLSLVMIGGGIWGVIDLYRQEVRAPLKSYGGAVSMVCGGVACWEWRRRCVYCSFFLWRWPSRLLIERGQGPPSQLRQEL